MTRGGEEAGLVPIKDDMKLAFFNETRYAFGRTAILLSGGASLGYYHLGLIYALHKADLLPRIISGSSAGSIMAAVVGTRSANEYSALLDRMVSEGDDVEEPWARCFFKISNELKSPLGQFVQSYTPNCLRWLADPVLSFMFDGKLINVDSQHFRRKIRELIGTSTFQEAFDKTSKIINITVAPLNDYDSPRLLNYLTAPHVCVWSAVVSSCSIPGIFDSSPLVVKTSSSSYEYENIWTRSSLQNVQQQNYSDGSIENDLPMKQLSELFNVNHFIVSQVNPHSALLSSLSGVEVVDIWTNPLYGFLTSYIKYLRTQVKYFTLSFLEFFGDFFTSARKGFILGALKQEYEGGPSDITIFPWIKHRSAVGVLFKLIENPNLGTFKECLRIGESAVWSHLERIRANCHVELTLDRCVSKLRRRIESHTHASMVASASAVAVVGSGHGGRGNGGGADSGSQESHQRSHRRRGSLWETAGRERRDSFVLSPSHIVNMNALSVSDPVLGGEDESDDGNDNGDYNENSFDNNNNNNDNNNNNNNDNNNSNSNNNSSNSTPTIKSVFPDDHPSISSIGSGEVGFTGYNVDEDEDESLPFDSNAKSEHQHQHQQDTDEKKGEQIKKSTNMTSFYYGRVNSEDKNTVSQQRGWQGL